LEWIGIGVTEWSQPKGSAKN